MKTIFKILVIVAVAFIVGTLFYSMVTATSSGGAAGSLIHEKPTGGFRPDGERFSGGIQFPMEMIKNLLLISVIVAAYWNISKYFRSQKAITRAGI